MHLLLILVIISFISPQNGERLTYRHDVHTNALPPSQLNQQQKQQQQHQLSLEEQQVYYYEHNHPTSDVYHHHHNQQNNYQQQQQRPPEPQYNQLAEYPHQQHHIAGEHTHQQPHQHQQISQHSHLQQIPNNNQHQQQQHHQQQQQQQQQKQLHHNQEAPTLLRTSSRANMQQVLLDPARQQLLAVHTEFQWDHESLTNGQIDDYLYVQKSYESALPTIGHDEAVAYQTVHQTLSIRQQKYIPHPNYNPNNNQQHHGHTHAHSHHLRHYDQPQNSRDPVHQMNDFEDIDPHHHHNHHHHLHNHLHDYALFTHDCTFDSCQLFDPSTLVPANSDGPSYCKATSSPLDEAIHHSDSKNVPNITPFANKPSHNSNIDSYPLASHMYQYESSLMGAIRHYWREISGLCLASAIFLNWIFVLIKRRFAPGSQNRSENVVEPTITTTNTNNTNTTHQATTRSISKDTTSSAHDSAFEELVSPISLDDSGSSGGFSVPNDKSSSSDMVLKSCCGAMRQRSSTLRAEPIAIPASPGHNSRTTSLSGSLNNSEYKSRYSSDFESIQRLGRGGFGIVFEAKNKIDDCHYAVKRICLPDESEARDRVMREVRALAKLDHPGIVRYYNAWIETPPDEWLKEHDAQLGIAQKDGNPSTDGIDERNDSENITKGSDSCCKFGDCGDLSSAQNKRRANGYHKFLRNNSSSPSLDIVFEGSGSIRIESENTSERSISDTDERDESSLRVRGAKNNSDIHNSDSEDSDFIQFESKSNNHFGAQDKFNNYQDLTANLTDPFSSTSSDSESDENSADGNRWERNKRAQNVRDERRALTARRKALNNQRALRQITNIPQEEEKEKVYLYIQMQLCRKDTLRDWLRANCEQRDRTMIFDLFYQIVDAVEYVHSQDLIHRDLKPSNIFFSPDGILKIGDFGLCRAGTSVGLGSSLDLQEHKRLEATEQVGTQLYMSPEQLNGLHYNQKVDIFAMGLILLELLIPFKTQMQRLNVLFKARNGFYSEEFRKEYPKEHDLVRSLLNRLPHKRPTATEIKQSDIRNISS